MRFLEKIFGSNDEEKIQKDIVEWIDEYERYSKMLPFITARLMKYLEGSEFEPEAVEIYQDSKKLAEEMKYLLNNPSLLEEGKKSGKEQARDIIKKLNSLQDKVKLKIAEEDLSSEASAKEEE